MIMDNLYQILSLDSLGGEKWLPLPSYEGLYDISNLGRVKNRGRWQD